MKVDNMTVDVLETTRKLYSEPNFSKDFSEYGQIHVIECSPYEYSQDLMLLAFETKIMLVHLNFRETLSINIISEFVHPCRCTGLSFSPNTLLNVLPNQVVFCSAGKDFKLRIFSSDLQEKNICAVLSGHTSYINDVMFDPENTYLASGSDDNTAKVWYTEECKLKSTFHLSSPAVNVLWHVADSYKLLVTEKIGLMKFFNVETETPILSLDFGKSLSSAHWAPSDSQLLASLQQGELLVWDLSKHCLPQCSNIIFPENGGNIRFSPQGELVAAVNGLDGSLKVVHTKCQALKLTASVTLPTNVRWHFRYPLVCVGDDSRLCFWRVTAK